VRLHGAWASVYLLVELNVAVAVMLPVIRTVHVLDVPEHAPAQLAKRRSAYPACAVSLTAVPCLNVDPDGVLVTVPLPAPLLAMVSV